MEIILLTSIVVTLFIVFIVATYREFTYMASNEYVPRKQEGGPRADMVNFMGRLFDNEIASKKLTFKQKDLVYKAMDRTIADMESDGIYFPEEVKEQMKRQREELYCEYSGLPSVLAYGDKEEEIKNEVIYLHQQGISCRNIAEQMNLSKSKVDRIIQSHKTDYKNEYPIGHS